MCILLLHAGAPGVVLSVGGEGRMAQPACACSLPAPGSGAARLRLVVVQPACAW